MDSILIRCRSCRSVNRLPAVRLGDNPVCGKCKTPLEFPKTPVKGTATNFQEDVLDWAGAVLVEFWAKWCGACRMISTALDELAIEKAGFLKIVKVDVDEETHLAGHFQIQATPTLIIYRNGEKVNQIAGALSKQQLEDWIERSLA